LLQNRGNCNSPQSRCSRIDKSERSAACSRRSLTYTSLGDLPSDQSWRTMNLNPFAHGIQLSTRLLRQTNMCQKLNDTFVQSRIAQGALTACLPYCHDPELISFTSSRTRCFGRTRFLLTTVSLADTLLATS